MQRVILRALGSSRAQVLKLLLAGFLRPHAMLGSSRAQVLKPQQMVRAIFRAWVGLLASPSIETGKTRRCLSSRTQLGSSRAQVLKQDRAAVQRDPVMLGSSRAQVLKRFWLFHQRTARRLGSSRAQVLKHVTFPGRQPKSALGSSRAQVLKLTPTRHYNSMAKGWAPREPKY